MFGLQCGILPLFFQGWLRSIWKIHRAGLSHFWAHSNLISISPFWVGCKWGRWLLFRLPLKDNIDKSFENELEWTGLCTRLDLFAKSAEGWLVLSVVLGGCFSAWGRRFSARCPKFRHQGIEESTTPIRRPIHRKVGTLIELPIALYLGPSAAGRDRFRGLPVRLECVG